MSHYFLDTQYVSYIGLYQLICRTNNVREDKEDPYGMAYLLYVQEVVTHFI